MTSKQTENGFSKREEDSGEEFKKRSYEPPEILSCEPLEAIAAVCVSGDPAPTPPNPPHPTGKNVSGGGCVAPGS